MADNTRLLRENTDLIHDCDRDDDTTKEKAFDDIA
jgi:hypothetical protein